MKMQWQRTMKSNFILVGLMGTIGLAGCENMPSMPKLPSMFKGSTGGTSIPGVIDGKAATLRIEERDVEAPDVFELTEQAIWDGRPSFGGVWAAVPGNIQPERVRLENVESGLSTVGALFKREAANPGPSIELSSDAAAALGVIPGQPARIKIVALRREAVDTTPAINPAATPGVIATTSLDPVAGTAPEPKPAEIGVETLGVESQGVDTTVIGAAIATAADSTATAVTQRPAEPRPQPPALSKAYVQVGTFASQANAAALVDILSRDGVDAAVRSDTMNNGKVLYRVVAGPSANIEDRAALLARLIGLGFNDAFVVSN